MRTVDPKRSRNGILAWAALLGFAGGDAAAAGVAKAARGGDAAAVPRSLRLARTRTPSRPTALRHCYGRDGRRAFR